MNLPIYLNNLGETYRIEGRYETSNKYFEEANEMAENVGDKKYDDTFVIKLMPWTSSQ